MKHSVPVAVGYTISTIAPNRSLSIAVPLYIMGTNGYAFVPIKVFLLSIFVSNTGVDKSALTETVIVASPTLISSNASLSNLKLT